MSMKEYIGEKVVEEVKTSGDYEHLMIVFNYNEEMMKDFLSEFAFADDARYKALVEVLSSCGERIEALENAHNELMGMVREMLKK